MTIYPHPMLPLFPIRLLPFAKNQMLNIEGMQSVSVESLTTLRVAQLPAKHQEACLSAITALMSNLFFGRQKEALSQISMQLPAHAKISDLMLNERAQAALAGRSFFKPQGPWRTASLMGEIHGASASVGPRLMLALLLAAEAMGKKNMIGPQFAKLEHELQTLVTDVVHSRRNTEIFLRAHGWNGMGRDSLALIAKDMDLTHERVRQLVRSAEKCVHKHQFQSGETALLRQAVTQLASLCPLTCSDAALTLCEKGLSERPFDVVGILHASKFLGVAAGMMRWVWEGGAFVRRSEPKVDESCVLMGVGLAGVLTKVHRQIRRHLALEGFINVNDAVKSFKLKHGIEKKTVIFAFDVFAGGFFYDLDKSWFVTLNPCDRAKRLHALLLWSGPLSIFNLVGVCEISQSLSTNAPADVLELLIDASGEFKRESDGTFNVIEPGKFDAEEGVRMESNIASLLCEAGGSMPRHLLRRMLMNKGQKSEDFSKQLRSSLIFHLNGKNVCLTTLMHDDDVEASFLASMSVGADFQAFAESVQAKNRSD